MGEQTRSITYRTTVRCDDDVQERRRPAKARWAAAKLWRLVMYCTDFRTKSSVFLGKSVFPLARMIVVAVFPSEFIQVDPTAVM